MWTRRRGRLAVEECLSGDFIVIEADKSKTYSQLYAAV